MVGIRVMVASGSLVFAAPAVTAQSASLQDIGGGLKSAESAAPVIYTARSFRTMDSARPTAEAIAVKDGRFLAVGTLAEVQRAAPDARIDRSFAGKTVTAGFIEQHVHPVLAALTMNTAVISIEDWDAIDGFSPAVRDPKAYEDRLKAALVKHRAESPGKLFVSWGYHHYFHGPMDRAMLNRLAPDFPVIIWHRSAHEVFLNDAALKLTGIESAAVAALPAPAQHASSLPKGHFYEQGFLALLPKLAPVIATPEQFRKGLAFTRAFYHRTGITLACEPGSLPSKPLQEAINTAYSDDSNPFNHCFIADGKSFFEPAGVTKDGVRNPAALVNATRAVENWGRGRTFYLPKQVKLFTDGAIFSQLMQMQDGYTDGHKGEWMIDPAVFDAAFQAYWDAGFQLHVHNNGDAGLEVLLASLEKAIARNPRKDHRAVLVHFGFAQEPQVKRWAELGGIVSSNPYYVTALAGRYAKVGIGPARAANMVPHSWVPDTGGALSFHSDMPMAPAKPLQLVWAGVNRLTAEGSVSGPQHRVSVDRAMRAITIDAAYSIQQDNRIGSIKVGKDANLTVLETDPYAVAPADLKDIKVWGTMLEGRLQPVAAQTASASSPRPPEPDAPDVSGAATAFLRQLLSTHSHGGTR